MRRKLHRAVIIIVSATLSFCPLSAAFAQQQPPPRSERERVDPAGQSDDVVRVTSNLVQVDAVVLDGRGRQVSNLQAADFEIVADGRVQQPENCSYIPITEERISGASPDERSGVSELRRSIVFLVANPLIQFRLTPIQERPFSVPLSATTLPANVADARAAARVLTRFIDQQMGAHDLVAIRESEVTSNRLAGLTTDRAMLRAAIEQVEADPLTKAPRVVINSAESVPQWVQQNLRVIQMMSVAVDQLERLPGRKLIVLLSRGMLYGINIPGAEIVRTRMHELIAKANRARVTVYTLNASGPDPANLWGGGLQDNGGLMNLARETGGRAIFNINDPIRGFADILEENRGYYLLSYNPGQEAVARPREIQVRVKRPGMRVQARRTVYAPGVAARNSASRPGLMEALASTSPFREIGLNLTPLFLSPDGRDARLTSLLNIDLTNVDRETREDHSQAINLEVIGQVVAPDGRLIYRRARTYSLSIPRADIERMLSQGIDYWFDVEANDPGQYQISVAVRDANSGRAGNATRFIEVSDLSRGALGASSLLLSRASEEVASASMRNSDIPALSRREFRSGGRLRYQCYVYNARRDNSGQSSNLQIQVSIKRGGVTHATAPLRTVSQAGNSPVLVGGDIMLETIPPGLYTIEVSITDMLLEGARTIASTDFQIKD